MQFTMVAKFLWDFVFRFNNNCNTLYFGHFAINHLYSQIAYAYL